MARRDLAETIRAALATGEPRQLRLALEAWEVEPLTLADAEGLVAVLAVVLTGKGTAALQEAGWIAPSALPAPRFELLGVYPSTVGLAAQAVVLAFVLGFFLLHGRASSKTEQHA